MENKEVIGKIDELVRKTLKPTDRYIGSDSYSLSNANLWKEIKENIEDFDRKRCEIYKKFYNQEYYSFLKPKGKNRSIEITGIYVRKSKKKFDIVLSATECGTRVATYHSPVYISDFIDPDFVKNYSRKLRKKRLEYLDKEINKCLEKMGELSFEQERLEKEEEGS